MDRLTSLSVFARVVDTGGFSAAARRLNMSVTMVSSHVQALEERLGVRLLNRTTRKVGVTEIGRAYYQRCTQILAELEEADNIAGELNASPRGTVRLYTSIHLARFTAPVIAEFLALYPATSVDLQVGERMVDLIEDGYDLAIRTTAPPDSTLITRSLTHWRHVLCCAPAYLEQHGAPADLDELTRRNCLRYTYYPFGDDWHFTGPDGKPASVKVTGNLTTTSAETMRLLALGGGGVWLAPSFIVAEDLAAGRVVPLLPDYVPVQFSINAVYPHRHHLSSKVRIFIDMIAARIAEHRKWLDPYTPPTH